MITLVWGLFIAEEVPSVIGLTRAEAVAKIEGAGLDVIIEGYEGNERSRVCEQDPSAGAADIDVVIRFEVACEAVRAADAAEASRRKAASAERRARLKLEAEQAAQRPEPLIEPADGRRSERRKIRFPGRTPTRRRSPGSDLSVGSPQRELCEELGAYEGPGPFVDDSQTAIAEGQSGLDC